MTSLETYLNKNPKKHLIFDFDETIVKLDLDWLPFRQKVAEVVNKYDSSFQYIPGNSIVRYTNDFIKRYGSEFRKDLWRESEKFETKECRGFIPNQELIRFINGNVKYKLYIFSSNTRKIIRRGLKVFRIADKFEKIVAKDDVDFVKPDLYGFKYIMKLRYKKPEYLMIGDGNTDEQAAKAIGIDYFMIDYFKTT